MKIYKKPLLDVTSLISNKAIASIEFDISYSDYCQVNGRDTATPKESAVDSYSIAS